MRLFLVASFLFSVSTSQACDINNVVYFANDLATAYKSNNLGDLDQKYHSSGPIKVLYEHSIAEEDAKDRFSVNSFGQLQAILDKRTLEGLPVKDTRQLVKCDKGECWYDFKEGILHNHLYLMDFNYTGTKECWRLEKIHLYDGD